MAILTAVAAESCAADGNRLLDLNEQGRTMIRRDALRTAAGLVAGSGLLLRWADAALNVNSVNGSFLADQPATPDDPRMTREELRRLLDECRRRLRRGVQRTAGEHVLTGAGCALDEAARLADVACRIHFRSADGRTSPAFWQACSDACERAVRENGRLALSAADCRLLTRAAEGCRQQVRSASV